MKYERLNRKNVSILYMFRLHFLAILSLSDSSDEGLL